MSEPFKMNDVDDETILDPPSKSGVLMIGIIAFAFFVLLVFFVGKFTGSISKVAEYGTNPVQTASGKNAKESDVFVFTDQNFADEIKDGVVLVDFWMDGCPPCVRMAPNVEKVAT
ncbi:MAG: thioredoxin family protein, partial [Thermoguttaceae bacterium]